MNVLEKKQTIIKGIKEYCGEGGSFYFEHGFEWEKEEPIYKGAKLSWISDNKLQFIKKHKHYCKCTRWTINLTPENFTLPQLKKIVSVIEKYEKHIETTEEFTMKDHISDYIKL